MKAAVFGFRHGHITDIIRKAQSRGDVEIVAVGEAVPDFALTHLPKLGLKLTHSDLATMIRDVEFDILMIGDAYGLRGREVIMGLEAGKHIMADKPLCTSLEEFKRIRQLVSEKNLTVALAAPMRYATQGRETRRLISEGAIGRLTSVSMYGPHPIVRDVGSQNWYLQKELHGGTLNDLMIHGVHLLPFVTGSRVSEIVAARAWHVEPEEAPDFQDNAQALLKLENGAGVFMDTSYKLPLGHKLSWSFMYTGTGGDFRTDGNGNLVVRRHNMPEELIDVKAKAATHYFDDFMYGVTGEPRGYSPLSTTEDVLDATERTLRIQQAADNGETNVRLP